MTGECREVLAEDGGVSTGIERISTALSEIPLQVLVICTANRCRSPMAACLLQRATAERGLGVAVASAGLLQSGRQADPKAVEVMDGLSIDLGSHRSRTVTPEMLGAADLVLTMERRHVTATAELAPDSWARTFTVTEFVRRADERGGRRPGEGCERWIARVHAGRRPTDLLRGPGDGDVRDPIGGSDREFRRCAQELSLLTEQLALLMSPRSAAEEAQVTAAPGRTRARRTFHRRR